MENKKIGAHRNFLNELFMTSLSSHISYKVEISSYNRELEKEGLYDRSEIYFNMADCNRIINLDFNIDNEDQMKNSLYKLDVIINTCKQMKKDLLLARKEILIGQKRIEEIKKEKNDKS